MVHQVSGPTNQIGLGLITIQPSSVKSTLGNNILQQNFIK